MNKYEFEDGMTEISGMGGTYEKACRKMVKAGMEWFDKHPKANPLFSGYEEICGIIYSDNEDAKKLSDVVGTVVDGCSGAQHQAAIGHIMHAHKVGWVKYVEEMKKR